MLSLRWKCAVSAFAFTLLQTVSFSFGQILYQESFETDGDGSRYTLLDPGYEEDTSILAGTAGSGPGIWGRRSDGDAVGLTQAAPAKRAAILWNHDDLSGDIYTTDALDVWASLASWAVDGKASAKIGFFPSIFPLGSEVVADRLKADGHDVSEVFDPLDIPADLDLLIHSSETTETGFSALELPIISYSATDHDDTAIAGLGQAIDFFEEVSVNVLASANGHPALGGKTGSIPWTTDATSLQNIGKTHAGGTVLATVVYEDPVTFEEVEGAALFVIDAGDALLGAFDPVPADGSDYLVGAALNKFGDMTERTFETTTVSIAGQSDLKLTVALAATAADFENGDYLRIEADIDGTTNILEEFYGVDDAASDCNKGLSNGDVAGQEGDICLQTEFNDYAWDIPAGSEVVVRIGALSTWGNEIVTIDNVRISSGEIATLEGDYNNNGMRDPGDLDLLAAAMTANDVSFDITGDGTTDSADRTKWVQDLSNTYFGDANFDGEFSSADFVTVFVPAKYETGNPATWSEGDWNGDGTFDSADFVTAFIGAGYEQGPRDGGLQAVPEPSSVILLLIGSLAMAAGIRRR